MVHFTPGLFFGTFCDFLFFLGGGGGKMGAFLASTLKRQKKKYQMIFLYFLRFGT